MNAFRTRSKKSALKDKITLLIHMDNTACAHTTKEIFVPMLHAGYRLMPENQLLGHYNVALLTGQYTIPAFWNKLIPPEVVYDSSQNLMETWADSSTRSTSVGDIVVHVTFITKNKAEVEWYVCRDIGFAKMPIQNNIFNHFDQLNEKLSDVRVFDLPVR